MSSVRLIKLVQEFLDAEIFLEQRRSETEGDVGPQKRRFDSARTALNEFLDRGSFDPADRPLAAEAIAYLTTVDEFHRARAAGDGLDIAARRLERVQRDLQSKIYRMVRSVAYESGPSPKRILVAVDENSPSDWAIATAVQLAESIPAGLKLVHVVPPMMPGQLDPNDDQGELEDVARRRAADLLRTKQVGIPAGIHCETLVRIGEPVSELVGAARRWGADFIVIGCHGRGPNVRFFLGSTAQAVIGSAPCPIIAVGHPPSGSAPFRCLGADKLSNRREFVS